MPHLLIFLLHLNILSSELCLYNRGGGEPGDEATRGLKCQQSCTSRQDRNFLLDQLMQYLRVKFAQGKKAEVDLSTPVA